MKPSRTLLRACGRGSTTACDIAKRIQVMYAGAVFTFADANLEDKNPNKLPFTGTLLLTDVPSTKPPHGAQGHRIFVPKDVVKKKLEGIIGMGINYDSVDLNSHVTRHKVGVVTRAWLEGNKVKISGIIWCKDFPESLKDLKGRKDLGLSMELADVWVADEDADVWHLDDFAFTGATILKKDAAAYYQTDLAARAAEPLGLNRTKGDRMKKDKGKHTAAAHRDTGQKRVRSGEMALMAQAIAGPISQAVMTGMGQFVSELKASNQKVVDAVEEMRGLHLIQAAAEEDDSSEDSVVMHAAKEASEASASEASNVEASASEASDVAAARRDADDSSASASNSSASASATDSSELEAMEDLSLEDASQEPGEVNKDASSRGSKTKVTKPPHQGEHFSGNVAKGRIHSQAGKGGKKMSKPFPKIRSGSIEAAAEKIGELHASNRHMRREIKAMAETHKKTVKKLQKRLQTVQAQVEHFAEIESRRSTVPIELTALAGKVGVDLNELRTNGQKLSVRAVDEMLGAAQNTGLLLNPEDRIAMKMHLEEAGLMDQGEVVRHGRA